MGRYNFRAQRVVAAANIALETKFLKAPPVWLDTLQEIPPPPRLTRPVLRQRAHKTFKPRQIKYPEDELRQEFYSDHPWELARPRLVLEEDGNDHKGYDWAQLTQEGKPLDGESVIRHQYHLMTNHNMSKAQAYDTARHSFYRRRNFEDVERRMAREEALSVGAYFGPGPNEIAEKLEDAAFERWKDWASKRVQSIRNIRDSGYSGNASADDDAGQQEIVEPEEETRSLPPPEDVRSGTDALADAVDARSQYR